MTMRYPLLTTILLLTAGSVDARLGRVHIIRDLQALGELEGLGGNPSAEHFPLQLCEGDCDEDSDCDLGLICYQRDPRMAVPGCMGGEQENSRTDFCAPDPALIKESSVTTATPVPNTAPPTTASPTTSATVMVSPVSSQPTPTSSPTFTATTSAPVTVAMAATPKPTDAQPIKEIAKVGNNGNPSWVYPLQECQGDCDDDDECSQGLICFHRNGGEPVPGCLGDDSSRNDYCIRDPDAVPSAVPTMSRMPTIAPSTLAPTSSDHPSLRPSFSNAPTSMPSDFPSEFPSDLPSSVPTISNMPTISAQPTAPPSGSPTVEPMKGIRMKLYWEEGYTWQDETVERKWCMISDYRGFPGTGKCWHGLHTEPCHEDMVYVARCDSDKRQMFSILPMPGGSQYQISLYDENKCLERYEYSLLLRECNYMNPLQRFWIPRGALYMKRFELSPITLANHCVTQSHHPKSGEVVELHKCSRARHIDHQSSFWNVY